MASSSQVPISPVTASKPELTITTAAINNEPVELDGTPVSEARAMYARRESKMIALEALAAEKGLSAEERAKREKLILERKCNPAVLVDPPQGPAPDELERSGAGDGQDISANNASQA